MKENQFLKKAAGPKPPTRNQIKHGAVTAKRGLGGGGLDALLKPSTPVVMPEEPAKTGIIEVNPMDLERSPWQPRSDFKEEALEELAASIKANGIIQPPVCRRRADKKLEIIVGERRVRASIIAGLKRIPVRLIDAGDQTAAEMAVTENIQRDDLNIIEEAEGYRLLQEKFGLIQEAVAERVGKGRATIANALRLLELPDEVKQLLTQNLITQGHAKLLLSVEDEKQRILDARAVVNENLTVRALEKRIARRNQPVEIVNRSKPDLTDEYVNALTDAIRSKLGLAVRLSPSATYANGRRRKGLLEIDFLDNEELDRLLDALDVKMN